MKTALVSIIILTCACISSIATAERLSVEFTDNNISKYSPADTLHGHYYLLDFVVPQSVKSRHVFGAFLELYLDISSNAGEGYVNETPVFEVYALKTSIKNELRELNANDLSYPTPVKRNVLSGVNKKLTLDITDLYKCCLKNENFNYGLVVGAITGARDGVFELRSGFSGQDVKAKITFVY